MTDANERLCHGDVSSPEVRDERCQNIVDRPVGKV
jgi:hypothetical protein